MTARILIAGFGVSGADLHLPAIEAVYGADVDLHVVDPDEARCRVARNLGIPAVHTELESAAASGSFDLAVIATPNHLHAAVARACAPVARLLLIEKPAVTSADELELLSEAGDRSITVHNLLFDPGVLALRDLIECGELGVPTDVVCEHSMCGAFLGRWRQEPAWRGVRAYSGGGAIVDLGYHLLYVAEAILGASLTEPVISSVTWMDDTASGIDADTTAGFVTHTGVRLLVRASWRGTTDSRRFTVFGDLASASMDDEGLLELRREGAQKVVVQHEGGLYPGMIGLHAALRRRLEGSHVDQLAGLTPARSLRLVELAQTMVAPKAGLAR